MYLTTSRYYNVIRMDLSELILNDISVQYNVLQILLMCLRV